MNDRAKQITSRRLPRRRVGVDGVSARDAVEASRALGLSRRSRAETDRGDDRFAIEQVPKSKKTFCKGCKKHAAHKVTQYKTGKASLYAQGTCDVRRAMAL